MNKPLSCVTCGRSDQLGTVMGIVLCAQCYEEMYTAAVADAVRQLVDAMVEDTIRGTSTSSEEPMGLLQA